MNLYLRGKKIGAWLQGIQGPWRKRIRNSKIKAITGVSLRNSQSNERHSKLSFASHLDFKQKGLVHNKFSQNDILSTFAIVCYSFAIKTICLERLFCCLTALQVIHQTWKIRMTELSHDYSSGDDVS